MSRPDKVKVKKGQAEDTLSPLPSPYLGPLGRKSADEESPLLSSYQQQHRKIKSLDLGADLDTDQQQGNPYVGLLLGRKSADEESPLLSSYQQQHRKIKSLDLSAMETGLGLDIDQGNGIDNSIGQANNKKKNVLLVPEATEMCEINNNNNTTSTYLDHMEEVATDAWSSLEELKEEAWQDYQDSSHYDWRQFWRGGGLLRFCQWILTGFSPAAKQTDEELQENLNGLARMISLLREYHDRFGMPQKGGPKDQEYILREITKDLYAGGAPLWTLEPVMKKVAEGLTGKRGVDFFMLPRRAFIFAPSSGATSMFRIERGYDMQRLDAMEKVAVRLASYASNTTSVANVPARWPDPQELRQAFRTESLAGVTSSKEEMADEILNLAADAEGLFFYINSQQYRAAHRGDHGAGSSRANHNNHNHPPQTQTQLGEFWTVDEETCELFSRLAAHEAIISIDKLDTETKRLYSREMVTLFRFGSSAGACAFWFNGSWGDIFVAGALGIVVAWIGASPLLSKQERIIFEAVASFFVGLVSGLVALTWPDDTCFGAMAISGVLDLLQGFRVVYSIIEIMSRHTVTGGADFFEGVFFTTLIAYFLKFGQVAALQINGSPVNDAYLTCDNGVGEWWYLLFVPIASISWSGLFNPNYCDLPFMTAHGVLGYVVSWQFYKASPTSNLNNFLAAACVTFCSGIVSRFTGRQALGNTIAGLYVLLPGAYLVTEVYKDQIEGFLSSIILRAVIIGLGAWTGTILCSPTLLGTNRGLLSQQNQQQAAGDIPKVPSNNSFNSASSISSGWQRRDKSVRKNGAGALLFF